MLFLSDGWLRVYAISAKVLDFEHLRFTGAPCRVCGNGLRKAFLASINWHFRWFPPEVVRGPAKADLLALMVRSFQPAC